MKPLLPLILLTSFAASPALTLLTEPLSWDEAYKKASVLVNVMTVDQIADITQGRGLFIGPCVGTTKAVTDPDFPALCLADGPLGVRGSPGASAFAAGISTAATFDRAAIRQRGIDMGAEFRAKGANVHLGPSMNIARVARAGRNWEGFGEDPYLSGIAAAETIRAVQSQGVVGAVQVDCISAVTANPSRPYPGILLNQIAAAKHFIGNEQETNRMIESSIIDDRTLHEVYLWPFVDSVDAGVGTIMCSYNKINGSFACENDYALNHILKGELGFKGWVHSDWLATHSTTKAINNGLDMTMPGGAVYFGSALKRAVKNGKITDDRAKDMALRTVAAWYKMRQDENYPEISMNVNLGFLDPKTDVQGKHSKSIRELGAAATVLLRNMDNILPIDEKSSIKSIAIIGSDAEVDKSRRNNTSCSVISKCDKGTLVQGSGSGASNVPYIISPLHAITKYAATLNITVASSLSDRDQKKALAIAKDSDVTFVFGKLGAVEGSDIGALKLEDNVDKLIEAVANVNNNTVVIIHSGNAVMMPWIDHPNVKAIIWAGLPGQESGNGLADVLFGAVNPSGRLPITFAKQESDYPADVSNKLTFAYSEKLLVGYRWFDALGIEPQFEFGFGLSYTSFKYSRLSVQHTGRVNQNNVTATASLTVRNTGSIDGAEVVQLYLSFPESVHEPPKVLRGFDKVFIKAQSTKNVTFVLSTRDFSIWDVKTQRWRVPEGEFTIHIGASSRDIHLRKSISIR